MEIKGKGGIIKEISLIYFPLGNNNYAYNFDGIKGVSKAEFHEEEVGKNKIIKWWDIKFGEIILKFSDRPLEKMPYENNIDGDTIKEWLESKEKITIEEIFKSMKTTLNNCYDFVNPLDCDLSIMFILQSWFSELFDVVFYVDIKSKMGGGKTLLLEIFKDLCKNAILANDISLAAIPRIIDKYGCTLLIDEVDMMGKKDEEIFKILRAGYKKGNKYIRCKPKTFEDECFEVYSAKAFNYRSDIPDDLKNRSIPISTNKSSDYRLPLISLYKRDWLIPLYRKIFIYYMNNSLEMVNKVNKGKEVMVNNTIVNGAIPQNRELFYSQITLFYRFLFTSFTGHVLNELSEKEFEMEFSKMFKNMSGRNIELFALFLNLSISLGIDLIKEFKQIIEEKEEFENYDDSDLKGILREVLIEMFSSAKISGCGYKYIVYKDLSQEFIRKVQSEYGYKPSTHELKKQLREFGFTDKVSRKLVKIGGKPYLCLLLDNIVRKNLDLDEVVIEKIEIEQPCPLNQAQQASTKQDEVQS